VARPSDAPIGEVAIADARVSSPDAGKGSGGDGCGCREGGPGAPTLPERPRAGRDGAGTAAVSGALTTAVNPENIPPCGRRRFSLPPLLNTPLPHVRIG
jgi:hypothetical protein